MNNIYCGNAFLNKLLLCSLFVFALIFFWCNKNAEICSSVGTIGPNLGSGASCSNTGCTEGAVPLTSG